MIHVDFANVKVSFVGRFCNRCAHEIARLGVNWDPSQMSVWADPLLESVKLLVVRDRTEPMS